MLVETKENKQIDGKFFILLASFFMSHTPLIIYCIFQCVLLASELRGLCGCSKRHDRDNI